MVVFVDVVLFVIFIEVILFTGGYLVEEYNFFLVREIGYFWNYLKD